MKSIPKDNAGERKEGLGILRWAPSLRDQLGEAKQGSCSLLAPLPAGHPGFPALKVAALCAVLNALTPG